MKNSFRHKLAHSQKMLGTIVSLPNASVTEALSNLGFDWLWIDMEHGAIEIPDVLQLLQATSEACYTLVRVPTNDETWIKRVLDLGPDGIIVPHVSTAEQARRAVQASNYPPVGIRSAGLSRAQLFGLNTDYVSQANDLVSVVVQIEHKNALANLSEIFAVEGLGGAIIGPYDLSGSMGKFGQFSDGEVKDAIRAIHQAGLKAGVPTGIFTMSPAFAQTCFDEGFQLVCLGVDMTFLWTAAKAALEQVKLPAPAKA